MMGIILRQFQWSNRLLLPYDHSEEAAMGEKSSQDYQFKGRFILTSVKSGLMIIDQQRTPLRILSDQYP